MGNLQIFPGLEYADIKWDCLSKTGIDGQLDYCEYYYQKICTKSFILHLKKYTEIKSERYHGKIHPHQHRLWKQTVHWWVLSAL